MKMLAVLSMILLLFPAAMAEKSLNARVEGNILSITWSVGTSGECTLTVYRDNWPIRVCSVKGGEGSVKISLMDPTGNYTVRLKTDSICLTANTARQDGTPVKEPGISPGSTLAPILTTGPKPQPAVTSNPTPGATAAPTVKPTSAPSGASRTDLAAQVVEQVNAERAKLGLSPLRADAELTRAACIRVQEIVRSFSHTRPDGRAWSTVSGSAYGENIAKGQRTADKVMAAWMTSQGHRENILRASYGSIGVCAYVYDGVVYWAQLFGK